MTIFTRSDFVVCQAIIQLLNAMEHLSKLAASLIPRCNGVAFQ